MIRISNNTTCPKLTADDIAKLFGITDVSVNVTDEEARDLMFYQHTLVQEMQERLTEYLRANGLARTQDGEIYASQYLRRVSRRTFGQVLSDLMVRKNVNGQELASQVGVHHSTVYYWLNNNKIPSLINLISIAEALHIAPGVLMEAAACTIPGTAKPRKNCAGQKTTPAG